MKQANSSPLTLDVLPVGVAHLSASGRLLAANDKFCDLVQQPKAKVVNAHLKDLLRDRSSAQQFKEALVNRDVSSREFLWITSEGHDRWVRVNRDSTAGLRDPRSSVVLTVEDITDRKLAERLIRDKEELIRAKEDRLSFALLASSQGLYEMDLRTWKVFLSAEYRQMLGYEFNSVELDYDTIRDWRHPSDDSAMQLLYQEYLDGIRTEHRYEIRQRDAQGNWKWVLTTGKVFERDHTGRAIKVVGTNADVTTRKCAEMALGSERTLLRTLIDALPDIVFTKDLTGRYVICNDATVKHLGGGTESEISGRTVFDFFPPELAQSYHDDDLKVWSGHSVVNQEERSIARDGTERWYLTIKVPLRTSGGDVTGLIGISRDITERRHAEELLRRSQKLESLGTLAGGIAHDFNNLLSAIIGNVRLAREQIPASSAAQDALQDASAASKRASELVRRILSFSRPQENHREVIQLHPVVDEALRLLRSTLPAMIQIESAFDDLGSPVCADAGQIHQLVVNLVTNAAHAIGDRPGTIRVVIDSLELNAKQAMAQSYPQLHEGTYVCLSVTDNGSGMDEATRQRIFDPFFTTKVGGSGTGLGLSIVHAIVNAHEGAVTVYSEPGRGTTFRIYLPATASSAASLTSDRSFTAITSNRHSRVLYVDDEASLVVLAKRSLERFGYQVTGFTDPVQALAAFKSDPHAFDAVVTDFSMPSTSGVELAREMRSIRPEMPVVLVTGFLQAEESEAIRAAGLSNILIKPYHLDGLYLALDKALGP